MIRFQRTGRRNDPSFRLALAEKRSKPKSGALELLGSFDSKTKQSTFKKERILYWLSKGAQASATAHNLLVKNGIVQGNKIAVKMKKVEAKEAKDANAIKAANVVDAAKEPTAAVLAEEKKEEAVSS